MKGRIRYSDKFADDIDEIWFYIAQDDVEAADRLIDSFERIYDILAENPYIGRTHYELRHDLRYFPYGSYIIFYFPTNYGVEIYRVLHAARDVEQILVEEFE